MSDKKITKGPISSEFCNSDTFCSEFCNSDTFLPFHVSR